MNTIEQISTRLQQRFSSYQDLLAQLDDELLSRKIEVPRHKSLAEHLWCLVGARESYAQAIAAGSWQGFSCSMEAFTLDDFRNKLSSSAQQVSNSLLKTEDWHAERLELLLTLAEHEVMHEGQIIRHMYALEQTLPESWVWA